MLNMKCTKMLLLIFSMKMALFVSNCIGQLDWQCIPSCKCIWVSGKKTAECKQQNITNIPDSLSREIQHLDLSGNNIKNISSKIFTQVRLDNLQKLVLRACNISNIHAEAFNGLRIIIEIDLSENFIEYLHRATFDETKRLRVLILNQNRLQKLEDNLFHNLIFLQKIELSDNHLVQIEERTFWNLPGLQTLTLNGNNLTQLNIKSFDNLPKLSSLELRNNPWNCDCYLKLFRDWAIQRKLYTKPTSCKQPLSLINRMWDDISDDKFACIPVIDNIGLSYPNSMNTNVYLWCKASAKPKPQIMWVHRQWILTNGTKRYAEDKNYILLQNDDWSNLTIPNVLLSDKGEYICRASNFGGIVEKNINLELDEINVEKNKFIELPLTIGIGIGALLFILVLTFCICYYRRRCLYKKNINVSSLDHHGLNEQKSLITAINPVVKPPRRSEAPSVTSHGTELTELNRTLLDNDSIFTERVGSVVGILTNGLHDEENGHAIVECSSTLDESSLSNIGVSYGSKVINSTGNILRNTAPYRQYPPDLLAFSDGRNSSPTSQTSTAPDNSKLFSQISSFNFSPSSTKYSSVGFKTLPHPVRASSATPYSLGHLHPPLIRHGYVTIPRRPRAPSWSSGPLIFPIEREIIEPVYDNLGRRTTADGSSVPSLNKSPESGKSVQDRPLPSTPTILSSSYLENGLSRPRQLFSSSSIKINRSAPEGAVEWSLNYADEQEKKKRLKIKNESKILPTTSFKKKILVNIKNSNTVARKVPPRPPPKPKQNTNGPLYEDEGEDGTEV